ncbi:MAG: DUF2236 domain-containing protein [Myxococcota bacterium]|nr:DUF2236 domain-containing protein [Myxococcota bacterium]MDW8363509.1 oxygenase MpaB family protein [Myxococcales bacterium]
MSLVADPAPPIDGAERRVPGRVRHLEQARRRWGGRADLYVRMLGQGDDLADAAVRALDALGPERGRALLDRALALGREAVPDAPPALHALLAHVEEVPAWVDFERLDHGARVYWRTGPLGPLVLSALSLMNGYHASAAVKPLLFTGRLDRMARRRLAETGRYVSDVCAVGSLRRGARGYRASVKVRLVHARIRVALRHAPDWDTAAWGVPINQADMAATIHSFSTAVLYGTRRLGMRYRPDEADALVQLWRYAGYLNGVDPALLSATEADALEWADLFDLVQPGPDEGSLRLAAALRATNLERASGPLQHALAPWVLRLHDGITRATAGDAKADALGIPRDPWQGRLVAATRLVVGLAERLREWLPGATTLAAQLGARLHEAAVRGELQGIEPTFDIGSRPAVAVVAGA